MYPHKYNPHREASVSGVLIATGIVFGDIGTSPLYTYKAVIEDREISELLALGSASCIIWTLMLLTTIKYIFIALKADKDGEGGILTLYTLVSKYKKWLLFPAIIGGSFMLAEGIITPPISVSSAIEGLKLDFPHLPTVPIVISIIVGLFLIQHAGTSVIGKLFGPVMTLWFTTIGVLGLIQLIQTPSIIKAVNPYYAFMLIAEYPHGFWLLGGVFLCTTGAEALYTDLGHCGRKNIRISWIYVKTCLILSYLGQAAWLTNHTGRSLGNLNPFFGLVPEWFLIPCIAIATLATIIASQALISGTFSMVTKAIKSSLWPQQHIVYPSDIKGQLFLPSINYLLMFGCVGMVLYFKEAKNMEAAYGLSVTITMLMTTTLLSYYLYKINVPKFLVILFLLVFLTIEGAYLISNLRKFSHGGWITVVVGLITSLIMYVWYKGTEIKHKLHHFVDLRKYVPILKELGNDLAVPKYATNLVYLTASSDKNFIEEKAINSILEKLPKRADIYWFVHVEAMHSPYHNSYTIDIIKPNEVVYVKLRFGFRVSTKVNYYFRKVVEEMVENKEINIQSRYTSLIKHNIAGDFRFVVIERFLSFDNDLKFKEDFILKFYFLLRKFSIPDEEEFGLDYSNVTVEKHPLLLSSPKIKGFVRDPE